MKLSTLSLTPSALGKWSFYAAVGTILVKVLGTFWLHQRFAHLTDLQRDYSYVGSDFPEVWPIQRKNVLMTFDNPRHFLLDTEDGKAEWASLVPGGNGVIHLGPYKQPFTISMFHQLRCLDIIRDETTRDRSNNENDGPTELGRHCLNYVRQMITCRGDFHLESFQYASHKDPIDQKGVHQCRDWEAAYKEVERNQMEYNVAK